MQFTYTVTHFFFWLQFHTQLHGDTLFLVTITHTQLHSDTLFLAAISHTVTHCFWSQLHTQLHSDALFLAAITHTVTQCFWSQLHTQLHSHTLFLAAITHTMTHCFWCNYSLHTQSCHMCHCDTLLLAESKTTHSHTLLLAIQFNSKTFIIPQGAVLLWSWRAHKKCIKLREQYN